MKERESNEGTIKLRGEPGVPGGEAVAFAEELKAGSNDAGAPANEAADFAEEVKGGPKNDASAPGNEAADFAEGAQPDPNDASVSANEAVSFAEEVKGGPNDAGVLGYAIRAGRDAIGDVLPAMEEEPVAVIQTEGGRMFMDEGTLLERIENDPEQRALYRSALDGLHEKLASGEDLGAPLGSADDFKAPQADIGSVNDADGPARAPAVPTPGL